MVFFSSSESELASASVWFASLLYTCSSFTDCVIFHFIQGSVPSLAAGLLFGGLAGLGAYQQSKDPKNVWLSLGKCARHPRIKHYW